MVNHFQIDTNIMSNFDESLNYEKEFDMRTIMHPALPFKINNVFYPSPRDIMNISNMFRYQQNIQTPLKSIYDNFHPNARLNENQNKEYSESQSWGNNINNKLFEDFNKFSTAKVESSELNSRELKISKMVKNPILADLEEMSLDDIEKYAFSLAKDQGGCRFLQKKLEEFPDLARNIFHKVTQMITLIS